MLVGSDRDRVYADPALASRQRCPQGLGGSAGAPLDAA
ncbi:MAG: hypothetical protein AVDCRST_MAG49-3706 [uncultured Thermomicrobiales bacterium]|uniref:Uncharacterized protein n=1 Tax=uncultured Thermomicrobiales bacterium TaxID=1645740 RepID=A0A6J4V817_9BACT|nr:MAG: hypothetical protein AVDCRST_MAG49-3706 [uncultured Thermomicrobiales bacterium]